MIIISPIAFIAIVWLLNDALKGTPSPKPPGAKAKARAVAAQEAAVASIEAHNAAQNRLDFYSSPYDNEY